jgi:hypothetical protein
MACSNTEIGVTRMVLIRDNEANRETSSGIMAGRTRGVDAAGTGLLVWLWGFSELSWEEF